MNAGAWAKGRGGSGRPLGLVVALCALCASPQAAERVALVIGNAAYESPDAVLENPGNDADGMAAALGRLGFEVVLGKDLDRDGFFDTLGKFATEARGADVALFFYAGHGLQVDGKNWLVPVDASLESKWDLERRAVKLDTVMDAMQGRANLVFLDACRNNPLARGLARAMGVSRAAEAATRGLARVEKGRGRFIGYATAPDDVAADGDGRNSPFTKALLAHIEDPKWSVGEMFGKVIESVVAATGGAQEPWQSSSLRGDPLHLASAALPKDTGTTAGGVPDKIPPPPPPGGAKEAYKEAKEVGTVAAYRIVVEDFPGTRYARFAQAWIDKHEREQEPLVVAGGDDVDEAPPLATPSAPSPEAVEQDLKLSDEARRLVQMGLAAAGYDPGPADGRFRGQTRAALRSWQGSKRMEVTGYLTRAQGEELTALGREAEAESKAREAAERRQREAAEQRRAEAERREQEAAPTPEEVEKGLRLSRGHRRLVQMGLAAAGYAPGPADGRFRARTRAALRSWQGSKRMEVTGYLTKEQGEELTARGLKVEAKNQREKAHQARLARLAREAAERRQREAAERRRAEAERRVREAAERRRAEAERREQVAAPSPKDMEGSLRLSREDRRLVQMGLAAAGQAPGPVDGKFGPRTRKALRAWQESKDLEGTGYLTREQSEGLAALGREEAQRLQAEAERQRAREAGTTFRDCPECPEMVVVPSGRFDMGSPGPESGRWHDEGPLLPVTIARPFAVGVYEVTRGEFARFVSATGRYMGNACWTYMGGEWKWRFGRHWRNPGFSQTDEHPVVCVKWRDAKAYVEWLSKETGEAYRLLSEAEWEYVARAGAETARYWGKSESGQCRYANGADEASGDFGRGKARCNDGHARTSPVGSYEANGYGLHDVLGNVWEWTEDCRNGLYFGAPRDGSAWTSGDCSQRMRRGGSWGSGPRDLRSANRGWYRGRGRGDVNGFRVARTLTPLTREQSEGLGLGREEAERQERERQRAEAERRERVAAEQRAREEERRRAEAERKRADDEAFARAKEEGTVSAFDGYLLWCGESCRHGVEARRLRAEAERFLPGKKFQDCARCPEMVVVPEGSFLMGSPEDEAGRDDDEGPVHRVTIARPFAVGVYEVTFSEWDACVSDGGCGGYRPKDRGWGRGRRPVINVSWEDAKAYVEWLSRETGEEYRLLSEAEWEYVARAGTRTRYWWGDKIGLKRASCSGCWDRWGGRQTAPVGSFSANAFGLYDVHGNVNEWVEDCWNESYRGAPRDGSAWESGDCSRRMLRGGHWSSLPGSLRSAVRGPRTILWFNDPGFRVARTLTP